MVRLAVPFVCIVLGYVAALASCQTNSPRGFPALRQRHRASVSNGNYEIATARARSEVAGHNLPTQHLNSVQSEKVDEGVQHRVLATSADTKECLQASTHDNYSPTTSRLWFTAALAISHIFTFILGVYIGGCPSCSSTTRGPSAESHATDAQAFQKPSTQKTVHSPSQSALLNGEVSTASCTEDSEETGSSDGAGSACAAELSTASHSPPSSQISSPVPQHRSRLPSKAEPPRPSTASAPPSAQQPPTTDQAAWQPSTSQHPGPTSDTCLTSHEVPTTTDDLSTTSQLPNPHRLTSAPLTTSQPINPHHLSSGLPPSILQGGVESLLLQSRSESMSEAQSALVAVHPGQSLVSMPGTSGVAGPQSTLVVVHQHTLDPRLTEALLLPVHRIAEGFNMMAHNMQELSAAASSLSSGLASVASTTRHLTDSMLSSLQLTSQGALASKVMNCGLAVHLGATAWSAALGGRLQEISRTCSSRGPAVGIVGSLVNGWTGGVLVWGRAMRCYAGELGHVLTGVACAVALLYVWRALLRGSDLGATWAFDVVVVLGVAVGVVGAQAMSRLGGSWVVWILVWWMWCSGVAGLSQKQMGRWRQVGAALVLGLVVPVVAGVVPFMPWAVVVQGRVEGVLPGAAWLGWARGVVGVGMPR